MEHAFPPEKQDYLFTISLIPGNFPVERPENVFSIKVQTLTTRDCKGPQTNMPKNIGSIKT